MLTIKQGDRYLIQFQISDAMGFVDLSTSTVRLLARRRVVGGAAAVLASTLVNPTAGIVGHTLDGSMDGLGVWDLEIEITDGLEITTAPTSSVVSIRVIADLG